VPQHRLPAERHASCGQACVRYTDSSMNQSSEKPTWVDALEESLLLAIGLFSLITWIITIGLLAH
jgi:hypothetical protein